MRYIALLLMLAACSTPQTILKSSDGKYVTCGGSSVGSVTGGMIGYSIQKDNDQQCVDSYKQQGYTIVKHADE